MLLSEWQKHRVELRIRETLANQGIWLGAIRRRSATWMSLLEKYSEFDLPLFSSTDSDSLQGSSISFQYLLRLSTLLM